MIKRLFLPILAVITLISCGDEKMKVDSASISKSDVIEEVIMSRRSIRKWQERSISRDTLDIIMKHGINAPNGRNLQAYEVRVIDNPELLRDMSNAVAKDQPEVAKRDNFKNIFVDAPCVVFIAASKEYDMSQIDCGLLGENIILSAWSMGIGSCCLGSSARMLLSSESAATYLGKLDFSDEYELLYCIALGYPDESPKAKPRKSDKIRYID